jgi:flavin-dependent dehydrogenase
MPLGQRAVVIGGSMAGLLAARVLSDYFAEVVLFERDVLPAAAADRKGVPQGRHAHGLLASGLKILQTLFPGVVDELTARGALHVDIKGLRWFDHGGYQARCSGIDALLQSRALLEATVRARLRAIPSVRIVDGVAVDSLMASADRSRVEGVRTRRMAGGAEEALTCDLTVDAAGRGSRTPAWLREMGFAAPAEDEVKVGLGYSTRIFKRTPDHLDGDVAMIIPTAPPATRGAGLLAMEGDRWMVTLFGMLGDHPPTDAPGFLEFASTLPAPDVYNLIRDAEPLTDIIGFKYPTTSRRHYEGLRRFPDGFLVFGDAICSFNPIYGQGMSTAALQAQALASCLSEGRTKISTRFFSSAAKVLETPWLMSVGGDLRYPSIEGPRTRMGDFMNWYLGKLQIAARGDPALTFTFHSVANLLMPPPALLKPNIALRVVRGNLFH